jgi:hypothetical protein
MRLIIFSQTQITPCLEIKISRQEQTIPRQEINIS